MDKITITIPDPATKAFIDQVLIAEKYPSASDYVLVLIQEDRQRRRQAHLEALLLEGLEGEPILMTDEVWEEKLRRYDAQQQGAQPQESKQP